MLKLIINPTEQEHHPDRYKAVLLRNGGLWKGYPTSMDMDEIVSRVSNLIGNDNLQLQYN